MSLGRIIGLSAGALFFAVLLWSYVHLSEAYEADVDIPVSLTAPKGFAVESGLPERLHARLRGPGWQILLLGFTKNSRFDIDLTERDMRQATSGTLVLHRDDLSHSVVIPSDLRLLKVEPDSLQLQFGHLIRKIVSVRPNVDVTAGKGYVVVGFPKVNPGTVTLEGSATVLDALTSYPTKLVSEHNAHETFIRATELSDTLQNMLSIVGPNLYNVKVEVQALGEKVFKNVPVVVDAVPPEKDVLLIPGTISLTLRGGVESLAKLKIENLRARVMYESVLFDTARSIKPSFDLPEGIQFLSSEPERLRFVIRKRTAKPAAPINPKR